MRWARGRNFQPRCRALLISTAVKMLRGGEEWGGREAGTGNWVREFGKEWGSCGSNQVGAQLIARYQGSEGAVRKRWGRGGRSGELGREGQEEVIVQFSARSVRGLEPCSLHTW